MITKFNLVKYTAIFSEKGKVNIAPGCAYDVDAYPKIIASFDSLAAAKEELNKLQSDIRTYGAYGHGGREYYVTEYGISKDYYNDDGEWEDCDGICEFSKFKINVISGRQEDIMMQCGDMETALRILSACEEVWLDSYVEQNAPYDEQWRGFVKVVNEDGDVIYYEYAVAMMDDDLREELHSKLAPCLEQEFFNEYCRAHRKKFNEDFILM